jgi:hypothetical protein
MASASWPDQGILQEKATKTMAASSTSTVRSRTLNGMAGSLGGLIRQAKQERRQVPAPRSDVGLGDLASAISAVGGAGPFHAQVGAPGLLGGLCRGVGLCRVGLAEDMGKDHGRRLVQIRGVGRRGGHGLDAADGIGRART